MGAPETNLWFIWTRYTTNSSRFQLSLDQSGGEGFETKVVDGVLWIRAESAMLGYLNAPYPFNQEGWFNTKDAVEVDGEYLRL